MSDPENLQGPAPTTPRQILTALALFLAGFAFVAFLLHLAIHDPLHLHADVRSEKLAMLATLHPTVSSAAFGTSRVHNGFDPRAFDAILNTRSINLGIEGGSQSEQRVMALAFIRQLPTPPPATPCLILLELKAGANFQNEHLVHPRAINIYDLATTRFVTHLTTPGMSLTQRLGRTGYALAAMLLHHTNIGMLSNEIFTPPLDQTLIADELKDNQRGQKIDPFSPGNRPSIESQLSAAHTPATQATLSPGNTELIADLAAAAAPNHTLAFAYFTLPVTADVAAPQSYPDHLTAANRDVPILDLARPDLYPDLYQPAMFHDVGHLSAQGAALASQLLARQLQAWYATHGAPPSCSTAEGHR